MKIFLILLGIFVVGNAIPFVSFAAPPPGPGFIDIWYGTNECYRAGPCTFCNGLQVVSNVVRSIFNVAIPIAVAMIIVGGFKLMAAGGNPSNVDAAFKVMTSALLGLGIALGAWVIVNTVIHILTGGIAFPWSEISCGT